MWNGIRKGKMGGGGDIERCEGEDGCGETKVLLRLGTLLFEIWLS